MGNVAGVQVEEVGRTVVGFDDCQVLRAEMRVRLLTGKDRKQKRQISVVRVQQIASTISILLERRWIFAQCADSVKRARPPGWGPGTGQ